MIDRIQARVRRHPALLIVPLLVISAISASYVMLMDDESSEITLAPTPTAGGEPTPAVEVSASATPLATTASVVTPTPVSVRMTPDPSRPDPPPGSLYIVDRGTRQVRVFSPQGAALFAWGAPAEDVPIFDTPGRIAVAPDGDIYLMQIENGDVIRLSAGGKVMKERFPALVPRPALEQRPDIAVTASGRILVLDRLTSRILAYGPDGVYLFSWGQPGTGEGFFSSPRQLVASDDRLLVLERSGRIQMFDDFGRLERIIEPDPSGVLQATAFTPLAEGGFAIVDTGDSAIKILNEDGDIVREIDLDDDVAPEAIVEVEGRLYVLDAAGNQVLRETDDGTFTPLYRDTDTSIGQLGVDNAGDLVLMSSNRPRLVRVSAEGERIEEIRTGGDGPGEFAAPWGVAVGPSGDVFVSDVALDRVQKFGPKGNLLAIWGGNGSEPGKFDRPRGLAVDDDGFVYVADSGNSRVQKFSADGEVIETWGRDDGVDLDEPYDVAIGMDGALYVADTGNNRIQRFDSGGGAVEIWGSFGFANGFFNRPIAIAVHDVAERVYIADSGNRRIQMLTTDGVYAGQWGSAPSMADLAVTQRDRLLVLSVEPDPRNRVRRYDIDGNFLIIRDRLVLGDELVRPVSIALAPG